MKKQIIAALLTLAILCSSLAAVAAPVQGDEPVPKDYRAVILERLNILPFADKTGDAVLTRAEICEAVMRFVQAAPVAASAAAAEFTDVAESHPYASAIATARALGVVNGISKTEFAPDQSASSVQAVKMIMSALGYDIIAAQRGGYPTGYLVCAAEQGVSKGVDVNAEEIVYNDFAALLFNALEANIAYAKGYNVENGHQISDETMAQRYQFFNINTILTATEELSLTGQEARQGTVIDQDGQEYIILYPDAYLENLGISVDLFYQEDDQGDRHLIYLRRMNGYQEVQISMSDFSGVNGNTIQATDESGRIKNYRLSDGFRLVYNFRLVPANAVPSLESVLNFSEGDIRLVEGNGNGYDLLFVYNATTIFVGNIASENTRVVDSELSSRFIELANPDFKNTVEVLDPSGASLALTDIVPNRVISVVDSENAVAQVLCGSSDKRHIRIVVSMETLDVEGAEIGQNEVYVDGERHPFSERYLQCEEQAQVGDSGVFYLTASGEIAAFDKSVGDASWLYAVVIGVQKSQGLQNPQVKLINEKNEIGVFGLRETLNCDGVVSMDSGSVVEKLTPGLLIRYAVDSNGEIRMIDTASETVPEGQPAVSDGLYREIASGSSYYLHASRTFGFQYYISSSAKVFVIPVDADGNVDTSDVDKDFSATEISYLSKWDKKSRAVPPLYRMDTKAVANDVVLVFEEKSAASSGNSDPTPNNMVSHRQENVMVIESIVDSLDDEGERTKKITGWQDGQSVSRQVAGEGLLKKLISAATEELEADIVQVEPGDLIQYDVDSKNVIDALDIVYDVSDNRFFFTGGGDDGESGDCGPAGQEVHKHDPYGIPWSAWDMINIRFAVGTVLRQYQNYIFMINTRFSENGIDVDDPQLVKEKHLMEGYTVCHVSKARGEITVSGGSFADAKDYDTFSDAASRIITVDRWGSPWLAIIYDCETFQDEQ